MSKRVFVTGAAGFIGYHAAMALKLRGDTVIGFDNFNAYYDPALKRAREISLAESGVVILEGDIADQEALEKAITTFSPTHILHLAAQAGVRYSLSDPRAYLRSNIDGFLNILECCRADPNVNLVYASSSSVYGLNEEMPFAEADQTERPASLYAATKKANEAMAHAYHHLFHFQTIGLRFFTVYGPWGRPDMALYKFTQAILSGKPIDVYNGGDMRRDFTYIDDIVSGILAAIDRKSGGCELYNLGNNKPEVLSEMITLLERTLGVVAEKNMLPMAAGDVLSTYADITRAQEILGFSPQTPLAVGLPKFVEWYQIFTQSMVLR